MIWNLYKVHKQKMKRDNLVLMTLGQLPYFFLLRSYYLLGLSKTKVAVSPSSSAFKVIVSSLPAHFKILPIDTYNKRRTKENEYIRDYPVKIYIPSPLFSNRQYNNLFLVPLNYVLNLNLTKYFYRNDIIRILQR